MSLLLFIRLLQLFLLVSIFAHIMSLLILFLMTIKCSYLSFMKCIFKGEGDNNVLFQTNNFSPEITVSETTFILQCWDAVPLFTTMGLSFLRFETNGNPCLLSRDAVWCRNLCQHGIMEAPWFYLSVKRHFYSKQHNIHNIVSSWFDFFFFKKRHYNGTD